MASSAVLPAMNEKSQSHTSSGGALSDRLCTAARSIASRHREPEWLSKKRLEALEIFAATPVPDRVAHLWRYSDPERFLPAGPAFGESTPEARIVADGAGSGVVVQDLHTAAESRAGALREKLASIVAASSGKFEALNAALWQGGVLVHVPRGVEVPTPIHIQRDLGAGAGFFAPRLLVIAEEGASVTVIDEYASSGAATQNVNAVVELFAGQNAQLRTVTIQRLGAGASLHLSQRAQVERDAKAVSILASLGGLIAKADVGSILTGRGAEVELLGFLFGSGRQHFDHHTVHDHRAPSTRSNLDFKVVVRDRARSAYTGLIRIAPEAPGSEAYQENKNLLLNDGAKVDSIPELEILTDEVMCTHGATMGNLDRDHVFYLLSRGIPRPEAERMIIEGFIEPTLARIPEDLREGLRGHVEAGLRTLA